MTSRFHIFESPMIYMGSRELEDFMLKLYELGWDTFSVVPVGEFNANKHSLEYPHYKFFCKRIGEND